MATIKWTRTRIIMLNQQWGRRNQKISVSRRPLQSVITALMWPSQWVSQYTYQNGHWKKQAQFVRSLTYFQSGSNEQIYYFKFLFYRAVVKRPSFRLALVMFLDTGLVVYQITFVGYIVLLYCPYWSHVTFFQKLTYVALVQRSSCIG